MVTKTTAPKIQKLKTNNYTVILDQFLKKHNLTTDSTSE